VVSALSACQLSADGNMHLRSVSPANVTGVICGWNVPDKEICSLASELHRTNLGLEVYVTSIDHGRVVVRDMPASLEEDFDAHSSPG
jgi:hypothetical protein